MWPLQNLFLAPTTNSFICQSLGVESKDKGWATSVLSLVWKGVAASLEGWLPAPPGQMGLGCTLPSGFLTFKMRVAKGNRRASSFLSLIAQGSSF